MQIWFDVTAKYVKVDESGHERKVTEQYMLDAVNFTEAEARAHEELKTMVSGEFVVSKITKTKITEIIPKEDGGGKWFKVKVNFITIDEESGKEKRVSQVMLVEADSVDDAYLYTLAAMDGMMCDFEIPSVVESKILDVFPYSEGINE